MRALILVTFCFLGGCASSLQQVQNVREGAPEWYEARKSEIAGRDYPQVAEIPRVDDVQETRQQLRLSSVEVTRALNTFNRETRGMDVRETPERMTAWAKRQRVIVERQVPEPAFMTDEEAAALRATFDKLPKS